MLTQCHVAVTQLTDFECVCVCGTLFKFIYVQKRADARRLIYFEVFIIEFQCFNTSLKP